MIDSTMRPAAMPPGMPRTGVCLVRIEIQQRGLLITLRTNDDIEQISTERVQIVADVDAAVDAVRGFLNAFLAGSSRR
jgi:hypothetical protein